MQKAILEQTITVGDEVVFNNPALDMPGKWEVMRTHFGANDGLLTLGVRPSGKLNGKITWVIGGWATRTGATYDH